MLVVGIKNLSSVYTAQLIEKKKICTAQGMPRRWGRRFDV